MLQNQSTVFEFILVGFSFSPAIEVSIFAEVLFAYVIILIGNIIILITICSNASLHTPMYFFIANISSVELLLTSCVIPKVLTDLLSVHKTISYFGCILQSCFYFSCGATELILMAAMSMDRYLAICKPLHYSRIMTGTVCMSIGITCWLVGFLAILFPTILMLKMTFCNSNIINHFFCDSAPLLKLTCTDSRHIEILNFIISSVIVLNSFLIIIFTYIYIIITILKISSVNERQKAFSTYASHLTYVALGYGGTIFIYVIPNNGNSLDKNKAVAILNIIVTPIMSPFIFSLRNNNVKKAIQLTILKSYSYLADTGNK